MDWLASSADGCQSELTKDSFAPPTRLQNHLNAFFESGISPIARSEHAAMNAMAVYASQVLTSQHHQLGRHGPVCPFIAEAMNRGLLYITNACHEDARESELAISIQSLSFKFSAWKESLPLEDRIYAALIIVFPGLQGNHGEEMVVRVQRGAKLTYLQQGLMIGEFYPGCPTQGVHSSDFRPLDAPVTSLAVRSLTLFDAPFMIEERAYVAEYIRRFGDIGRKRVEKLRGTASTCPVRPFASAATRLDPAFADIEA